MGRVTIRVLDGADRGRVFEDLPTPITIGREEGNTIQLNDERVSRFHVKIQEDHDQLVLTDLESTNGTKVNGEDIQLRILRFGDMIALGRSVLLIGSRDQIASRLKRLRESGEDVTIQPEQIEGAIRAGSLEFEVSWDDDTELQASIYAAEPPELPQRLSPGQAAQLAELMEFLHIRVRQLLSSVRSGGKAERITLELRQWQNLIDLQARLSEYLREIGEPQEE